jgi:hypothetical protein
MVAGKLQGLICSLHGFFSIPQSLTAGLAAGLAFQRELNKTTDYGVVTGEDWLLI